MLLCEPIESGFSEVLFGDGVRGGAGVGPPQGVPGPVLGLSLCHKAPFQSEGFTLTLAEGGHFARFKNHGLRRSRPGRGGKRGQVRHFSRTSAYRLLSLLQAIDRSRVSQVFFITMTAPPGVMDFDRVKEVLEIWWKRVMRRWGACICSGVWKAEPHKSGWPHLHVLFYWMGSPPGLAEFREWNDLAWVDSTGVDDLDVRRKMLASSCEVQLMRSFNGAISYATKYMCKEIKIEGETVKTGRCWGVKNRVALPMRLVDREVAKEPATKAQRCLRKLDQRKRTKWFQWATDGYTGEKRWFRVRDGLYRDVFMTAQEQCEYVRAEYGHRVKCWRPRCGCARREPVWAECEETAAGVDRRYVEKVGDESVFYPQGRFFVASGEVDRCVRFFEEQHRRDALLPAVPF